jgi:hypothetical protein
MRKALLIIVTVVMAAQSTPVSARGNEQETLYSHIEPSKPYGSNERARLLKPKNKPYSWYLVVCTSRANQVVLQAGSNKDDNVVFAKWHQGDGQRRFPLPGWLQARTQVHVGLSIPDGRWQTEACVGYEGYAKRSFRFDTSNDNDVVSMDDNDNGCACR